MTIQFNTPSGRPADHIAGFIPDFVSEHDPRPAAVQIAENYIGGWRPLKGCTLRPDNAFSFPGDPLYRPIAIAQCRHETLVLYPGSFLAIIQPDRSFEISRVD